MKNILFEREMLDKIQVDFKYIDFGRSTSGFDDHDDDGVEFNNFELTVSYNGKKVKLPYSIGNLNIKGLNNSHLQGIFKMDLVARIITDCYPFKTIKELKNCFISKGYEESEEFEELCQQAFADVNAQSEKWRKLFTENDLKQLKIELQDWFDSHPEHTIGKIEILDH